MQHTLALLTTLLCLACHLPHGLHAAPSDPARDVNPFFGTLKAGNTTPSARAPFGMISPGPHNDFENYGGVSSRVGYHADRKRIIHFNLTHLSGVGLHAGGDLPFMPTVGDLGRSPVAGKQAGSYVTSKTDKEAYASSFEEERAGAGWYEVRLKDSGIAVSLSAAPRSAIARFRFPKDQAGAVVFCPANDVKGIVDSFLRIDPEGHRVSGWADTGGFSDAPFNPKKLPYRIYFTASFDAPFQKYGIWETAGRRDGVAAAQGPAVAAFVGFDSAGASEVTMRVAISYVDAAGAEANLAAEAARWDEPELRRRTRVEWNERLGALNLAGAPEADRRVWNSCLYLNLLHPNYFEDADGRYRGFDDQIHRVPAGEHFFANYSIWDTYRSTGPLQALIVPREAGGMARTMLRAAAEGGGGLPNWTLNNNETACMGCYPGATLLANLIAFGAQGIDLKEAHLRLVASATRKRPLKTYGGWDALEEYEAQGFKPRSASETLEYNVSDFALARFCRRVGDESNAERFMRRAASWRKLVHPERRGIWARQADGSWLEPLTPETGRGFTEGCAEQYLWFVPHDTASLLSRLGSPEALRERLSNFFDPFLIGGWNASKPKYWCGNEPTMGAPFVFNYLGEPWRAQELVSRVAATFTDGPGGMPGDDDLGATSASYLFFSMGLFPYIPGVGGFIITGPRLPYIDMTLRPGVVVKIRASNAGPRNPYIQSLTVNGKAYRRTWIDLETLAANGGATLSFAMGPEPMRSWGSRPEDAPPSPGSEIKLPPGYEHVPVKPNLYRDLRAQGNPSSAVTQMRNPDLSSLEPPLGAANLLSRAPQAIIRVIGPRPMNGASEGMVPRLCDGLGAQNHDDPSRCAWFDGGSGRLVMDLGLTRTVSEVRCYSWHRGNRAPQKFLLWGAQGPKQPEADFTNAAGSGWTLLADVNTEKLGDGGAHLTRIRGKSGGSLGDYRFLLWITPEAEQGTFFTELEVAGP